MAQQIQLRRGNATQWTNSNPRLAQGEIGVELDTGRFKVGNGTAQWNTLPYATGQTGPTGPQGPGGVVTVQGLPFFAVETRLGAAGTNWADLPGTAINDHISSRVLGQWSVIQQGGTHGVTLEASETFRVTTNRLYLIYSLIRARSQGGNGRQAHFRMVKPGQSASSGNRIDNIGSLSDRNPESVLIHHSTYRLPVAQSGTTENIQIHWRKPRGTNRCYLKFYRMIFILLADMSGLPALPLQWNHENAPERGLVGTRVDRQGEAGASQQRRNTWGLGQWS